MLFTQLSYTFQDITFGNNENQLDLYFPESGSSEKLRPVVVFIYGGAWGSGNKSMYSLLCSQLADKLDAVVCCPNYSLYPKVSDLDLKPFIMLTYLCQIHPDYFGKIFLTQAFFQKFSKRQYRSKPNKIFFNHLMN